MYLKESKGREDTCESLKEGERKKNEIIILNVLHEKTPNNNSLARYHA